MEGRSRVLCKFFLHGACLKGSDCTFSHNWSDQESQVCTFYQRGLCTYGAHCRYEHVKVSRVSKPTPSPFPVPVPVPSPRPLPATTPPAPPGDSSRTAGTAVKPSTVPLKDAWQHNPRPSLAKGFAEISLGEAEAEESEPISDDPSDRPICAFAAAGNCPQGESCRNIHGALCPTCGKLCLHPYRPSERENHKLQCQRNKKNLEALLKSQDIECSVCLERIHSKPTVAERKFGLMSGCDHPFCVGCIRGWRSGSHAPGMDIDTVVRACPVCRVPTHYVVPSVVWYFSPEEKEEIINGYKNKLGERDCRHFDFGNGTCPFGTSCFYKHAFKDGTLEEVKLRHLGAADGSTVIVKNVRFFEVIRSRYSMDTIVLNTDDMDAPDVLLHHLVPCVYAKRQPDSVPGFTELSLHIITGILLHSIGSCFSFSSACWWSCLFCGASREHGVFCVGMWNSDETSLNNI